MARPLLREKALWFLKHEVERNGQVIEQRTTHLSPVYYIPGLSSWLMSMGEFLHSGLEVQGIRQISWANQKAWQNCYAVFTCSEVWHNLLGKNPDCDAIQSKCCNYSCCWLWHLAQATRTCVPKGAQQNANKHNKNSLGFKTPKFIPICPGCAEGKMKSRSFPESQSHATSLFELVHSDLKSLLVESYHRFKYFIVFIDDKSSHMWTANLRRNLMHLKRSRTSRQWPESSMVQPSKDGESIKGGSLSTPILWIP